MWGAILTRREEQFKRELEFKLKSQIKTATKNRDEKVLKTQNKYIRKISKLNIEYKYDKATKSMIHDWEKSQANSMIGALKYLWLLV
jgi:hypothetical protein